VFLQRVIVATAPGLSLAESYFVEGNVVTPILAIQGITIDNTLSGYIGVRFSSKWILSRSELVTGNYMAEVTVMYLAYNPSQRLSLQDLTAGDTNQFLINGAELQAQDNVWISRVATTRAPGQLIKSYAGTVPAGTERVACTYNLSLLGLSPAGQTADHLFDITVRLT
jgi:hypothetical protein